MGTQPLWSPHSHSSKLLGAALSPERALSLAELRTWERRHPTHKYNSQHPTQSHFSHHPSLGSLHTDTPGWKLIWHASSKRHRPGSNRLQKRTEVPYGECASGEREVLEGPLGKPAFKDLLRKKSLLWHLHVGSSKLKGSPSDKGTPSSSRRADRTLYLCELLPHMLRYIHLAFCNVSFI